MGRYLGLDSSTQSLSALCVDTERGHIVHESSINFAHTLPEYSSPNGFLETNDPLVRHANPLMWLEALDRLFEKMKKNGFDFSSVDRVSGSGQQHGSVYLNRAFLNPAAWKGRSLKEIFAPLLSRKTSPIWMDSSTAAECAEIADKVGGNDVVREKTGSIMVERFTGAQIRKFYKENGEAYENTAAIHLVSSFMASVLAGENVPIDLADASGMNLLNLGTAKWDEDMLDATAPDLKEKLPNTAPSNTTTGRIGKYFVKKFGFKPECDTMLWSGDNPNSLVALGASGTGTAVISLGTSDTFMAAFERPATDPNGYGHAFFNPDKGYMCLICFKNGSLAREKIRDEFSLDWDGFELALRKMGQDDEINITIPFYFPEITPKTTRPAVEHHGDADFTSRKNAAKAIRAIVESQMVNMRTHSAWLGGGLKKIKITGGASRSDAICQIAADVFQVPVERLGVPGSAGLGAAIRAAGADAGVPLSEISEKICSSESNVVFAPDSSRKQFYGRFENKFAEMIERLT